MSFLYVLFPVLLLGQTPTPVADNLSINIQQTRVDWHSKNGFPYIGDTVIEVRGKIGGTGGANQRFVFGSQWGGPKFLNFHYTAHLIHDGKGYVVAKNLDEDEGGGISEVKFVIYDFMPNEGAYERKELSFEDQTDGKWYIAQGDMGGATGGLYISKDKSLLLKTPVGINLETGAIPSGDSNHYEVYSLKTLQLVEKGRLGNEFPIQTDKDSKNYLVLDDVEYELW